MAGYFFRAAAQDEVVDELHEEFVHLDVEGFYFVGEVVVSPDGGDGNEETEGGGDERFGDTAGDGGKTGGLVRRDALNAFKMPTTVPKRPTNGAVEPMVSEGESPRFNLGMDDGDGALQTALGSVNDVGSETCCEADWNSERPVATTLAMWLFLLRSAIGDGFVELAVLESAGHLLHEDARLLASRAVHEEAIDHDAEE